MKIYKSEWRPENTENIILKMINIYVMLTDTFNANKCNSILLNFNQYGNTL